MFCKRKQSTRHCKVNAKKHRRISFGSSKQQSRSTQATHLQSKCIMTVLQMAGLRESSRLVVLSLAAHCHPPGAWQQNILGVRHASSDYLNGKISAYEHMCRVKNESWTSGVTWWTQSRQFWILWAVYRIDHCTYEVIKTTWGAVRGLGKVHLFGI